MIGFEDSFIFSKEGGPEVIPQSSFHTCSLPILLFLQLSHLSNHPLPLTHKTWSSSPHLPCVILLTPLCCQQHDPSKLWAEGLV